MGKMAAGWRKLALLGSAAVGWTLGHAHADPITHNSAPNAHALPQGGSVVAGQASIGASGGQLLVVEQQSQNAIINWSSFDIGAGYGVHFDQPNAQAAALNRVTGDTPSTLAGALTATGSVFLVNPNGIGIAPGAIIDTGSFAASTLDIADADFLSGTLTFRSAGRQGAVVNQGVIRVRPGGQVALIGSSVVNQGAVQAQLGSVTLAAGELVTLDFGGDGFLSVSASEDDLAQAMGVSRETVRAWAAQGLNILLERGFAQNAMLAAVHVPAEMQARAVMQNDGRVTLIGGDGFVDQAGTISAQGGQVFVGGNALVSVTGAIDVSGGVAGDVRIEGGNILSAGVIDASGAARAGRIDIDASGRFVAVSSSSITANGPVGGAVAITADDGLFSSGTIEAIGRAGAGGTVSIAGADITLVGAHVNASGTGAGGEIRIGFAGNVRAPQINADVIDIAPSTTLAADATQNGDGGLVALWSRQRTSAFGAMSARGGTEGGDGGFIEASSRGAVFAGGAADAGAVFGREGVFSLDPHTIIIDDLAGVFPHYQLLSPTSSNGDLFGADIVVLSGGAVVVTAPGDSFGGANAGAAFLFDPLTGALRSALIGASANDQIGNGGIVALSNGNYAIASPLWGAANAGAVTWGSGVSGVSGLVSAVNSLVGAAANDQIGGGGIVALSNGHYVVASPNWNGGVGAATWGDGQVGSAGLVGAANSLIGASGGDQVSSGGIFALSNGHYVVASPFWANGLQLSAGAVTWRDGAGPAAGLVGADNSLIGLNFGDRVGVGGVVALSNGNYVVSSPYWALEYGAATWGDGTAGLVGAVSIANSLIGSSVGDHVSINGVVEVGAGNYVVLSRDWDNGGLVNAGAATWGDGALGTFGAVSAANSLVGANANDFVSLGGVTVLANGNYVVASPIWNNGGVSFDGRGAATWGSGSSGIAGVLSASNSLVGGGVGDRVGLGGVVALTNGHYVVSSPLWTNAGIYGVGAATWGDGTSGIVGAVSAANSLVGSNQEDFVGGVGLGPADFADGGGIVALANGHYVVRTPFWDNGAIVNAGAATWVNGDSAVTGAVSAANSLVGSAAHDRVSSGGVAALTNGKHVVSSPLWDNGAIADAGAATLVDGAGIVGAISSANSLIGATSGDQVGAGGTTVLANGNYVVRSPFWTHGGDAQAGAVTWGAGASGVTGELSAINSIVGAFASQGLGALSVLDLEAGAAFIARAAGAGPGEVYVGLTNPNQFSFARAQAHTLTVRSDFITRVLDTGTAVDLQANTDIFVNSNLITNNAGGALSLRAGRSIFVNALIQSDDGDVTLIANETAAGGVVDAQRDPGAAQIFMGALGVVDAGAGAVRMIIRDGAGLAHAESGAITLGAVTGASVIAENLGLSPGSDVIVNGAIQAAGLIALAAPNGDFHNNHGAGALNAGGRFLVFSRNPANNTSGGLAADPWYNTTYDPNNPAGAVPGLNRFVYALAPVLTVTASDVARLYGDADLPFGYGISGLIGADTQAGAVQGAPSLITAALASSDVGAYDIVTALGGLSSAYNYGFAFVNGALTIQQRPVTVTAADVTRFYGDSNPALTYATSSLGAGAPLVGVLATDATPTSNVGAHAITQGGVTNANNPNYVISFVNGALTIQPRAVTVTADDLARAYGDANPALTFTNSDLGAGVALVGAPATAATPTSNVGGYAITQGGVTNANNPNYAISFINGALIVQPRAVTVTADDLTRLYGDANPALTFTTSDLGAGVDLVGPLATDAAPNSNVGVYAITEGALAAANPNYAISFVNGELAITPRPIVVTAHDIARLYGDPNPALTFATSDLGAGAPLAGSPATAASASSAVGAYAIVEGGLAAANPNYAIAFVDGVLTIQARPIIVTADDLTRIYGDANPALTFTTSDIGAGAALVGALETSATAGSGVGAYAITQGTLTESVNPNYVISFVNGALSIAPRPIVVTADDLARLYGDANPNLTFTTSHLGAGAPVVGAPTTSAAPGSDVGGYAITQGGITNANNPNYLISFVNGVLTIAPRPIVLTADDLTRFYGDTNPNLTFTTSDLGAGVSIVGAPTTSAAPGSNVGAYAITQGTLIAAGNPNYVISFVNGVLTIAQRPIVVTADDLARFYGDANPALTFTTSDLGAGAPLAGVLATSATPSSNVGAYAVTGGALAGANPNYLISFVNGALTIQPRAVTVTVDDLARIYGDANPALTFTTSDLGAGAPIVGALATTATASSNVGAYAVTGDALAGANPNYAVNVVNGILTVQPRALTVTADRLTRIYGNANPALTFTISDLGAGAPIVGALATAATASSNVGAYAVTAGTLTGANNPNYAITFVNGALTVTPRAVTVAAHDQTKLFGQADPAFTYVISVGALFGSDIFVGALARDPGEALGDYAINLGALALSPNYVLSFTPGALTITPQLSITHAPSWTPPDGAASAGGDAEIALAGPSGVLAPGAASGRDARADDTEQCIESAQGVCVVGP